MNRKSLILIFLSLSIIGLLLSCEKKANWTCKCTYVEDGVEKSRTFALEGRTKSKAEDNCNSGLVGGSSVSDAHCELVE